jgi:hypothetical protein
MPAHTKSWDQVGQQFEAVGAQLRKLADEANDDFHADRAAFEKAVRALFTALDDSLDATRKIVRDPVLRKDLGALADAVRKAVKATLVDARHQVAKKARLPKVAKPVSHKPPARSTAARRPAEPKAAPHRTVSRTPATSKRS